MKKNVVFVFIIITAVNSFGQKNTPLLDSVTAANLIVGTWVDTQDPIHIFKLTTELYSASDKGYKFSEEGIKEVSYIHH
jgi:hypothetical protein